MVSIEWASRSFWGEDIDIVKEHIDTKEKVVNFFFILIKNWFLYHKLYCVIIMYFIVGFPSHWHSIVDHILVLFDLFFWFLCDLAGTSVKSYHYKKQIKYSMKETHSISPPILGKVFQLCCELFVLDLNHSDKRNSSYPQEVHFS